MTPNTRSTFTARLQQGDIYSGEQPSQKSIMDPTLSFFIDTSNWAIRNTLCVTAEEGERETICKQGLCRQTWSLIEKPLFPTQNWLVNLQRDLVGGTLCSSNKKDQPTFQSTWLRCRQAFWKILLICVVTHVPLSSINMLNQTITYLHNTAIPTMAKNV